MECWSVLRLMLRPRWGLFGLQEKRDRKEIQCLISGVGKKR